MKLTIIRGLPGSGKSTYAQKMVEKDSELLHLEADTFFNRITTHEYDFDIRLIEAAHSWCYGNTVRFLREGYDVVVSNTFTRLWELDKYLSLPAIIDGLELELVEMRTQFENIHNVPADVLKNMATRWQPLPEDFPHFTRVIDQA